MLTLATAREKRNSAPTPSRRPSRYSTAWAFPLAEDDNAPVVDMDTHSIIRQEATQSNPHFVPKIETIPLSEEGSQVETLPGPSAAPSKVIDAEAAAEGAQSNPTFDKVPVSGLSSSIEPMSTGNNLVVVQHSEPGADLAALLQSSNRLPVSPHAREFFIRQGHSGDYNVARRPKPLGMHKRKKPRENDDTKTHTTIVDYQFSGSFSVPPTVPDRAPSLLEQP